MFFRDINHRNIMTVAPKFIQHVNFGARGDSTLDLHYTYIHRVC